MLRLPHRIVTTGLAIVVGAPPAAIVGAYAGATFPDIDIRMGIPHRTWTHWLPLYGILMAGGGIAWVMAGSPLARLLEELFMGFVVGAILHIIEDAPTHSGIPILTPNGKHFSFNWTYSGGMFEKVVALAVVGLVFWTIVKDPFSFERRMVQGTINAIGALDPRLAEHIVNILPGGLVG